MIEKRIYIFVANEERASPLKELILNNLSDKKVDVRILEHSKDIVMKMSYKVSNIPTIVVLDPKNNHEVKRFVGPIAILTKRIKNKEIVL